MSAKLLIWSSCVMRLLLYFFFAAHSLNSTLWIDVNVCVVYVYVFFSFNICLFSLRISLTHCVVSRSTSVIIITLALYFIWHAASSSPLDTFLFIRASLSNTCSFRIEMMCAFVRVFVCVSAPFPSRLPFVGCKKILYANIQQKKRQQHH